MQHSSLYERTAANPLPKETAACSPETAPAAVRLQLHSRRCFVGLFNLWWLLLLLLPKIGSHHASSEDKTL